MEYKGRFNDLNPQVNEIMYDIIMSKDLSRLLYYNDKSPLSSQKPDIPNPYDLLYNKVFPMYYVPDTNIEASSFVTISLRGFRPSKGDQFTFSKIYFHAIVHKDLVRTNYGQRTILIMNEIDKLFNDKDMGVGKLTYNIADEMINLPKEYNGYYVCYELTNMKR